MVIIMIEDNLGEKGIRICLAGGQGDVMFVIWLAGNQGDVMLCLWYV